METLLALKKYDLFQRIIIPRIHAIDSETIRNNEKSVIWENIEKIIIIPPYMKINNPGRIIKFFLSVDHLVAEESAIKLNIKYHEQPRIIMIIAD